MRFLRTLFWVVVAISLALFARANWSDVTLSLWGNVQMDIKIPVLILIVFLIGFLPVYFMMRGRLWNQGRKLILAENNARMAQTPSVADPIIDDGEVA